MEFEKRNPKIFLLSGKARSGKSEVAKYIEKYYKDKMSITISFGHYNKDYAKRVSDWDGSEETKPRELLQQLGIELIKNKIDDKLFIRRILEDIEVFSYFYDIIIVSDVRLIDELSTLKNKYKESISIRVNKEEENDLTTLEKKHITETDLDYNNDFDYIVDNDKYLEDKINKILEGLWIN